MPGASGGVRQRCAVKVLGERLAEAPGGGGDGEQRRGSESVLGQAGDPQAGGGEPQDCPWGVGVASWGSGEMAPPPLGAPSSPDPQNSRYCF